MCDRGEEGRQKLREMRESRQEVMQEESQKRREESACAGEYERRKYNKQRYGIERRRQRVGE